MESVSAIVPTLGRSLEVKELLDSLLLSDVKPLEIIIVDQNQSDLLDNIISSFSEKLTIKHLKVDFKGASRARNFGISHASGAIYCFPDDDARFFKETITIALATMKKGYDVVFGRCVDETGENSVVAFDKVSSAIELHNMENKFAEATMFSKSEVSKTYLYDETLGVGTFHGAEEAYDLVIRLLKAGKKLYYTPEIIFYHPSRILNHFSDAEIKRVFSYRCGFSKLCLKHKLYGKLFSRALKVLLYSFFLAATRNRKARYYFSELAGLFAGVVIR